MLERFKAAKRHELRQLEILAGRGALPPAYEGPRPSFRNALALHAASASGPAIVAEYKRASPSCGAIDLAASPEDVATAYAAAGAQAISVLTEELHFRGELDFIRRMTGAGLPLLRKDFIMHPAQVEATAATPASALLLIVRLTPDVALLRDLREQAEQYGMDAVVEVFNEEELGVARASGARIVQVNARDLDTLKVERAACLRLAALRDPAEVWIAASGISLPEHVAAVHDAGFDAALVGTMLMAHGDPAEALRQLRPTRQRRMEPQLHPASQLHATLQSHAPPQLHTTPRLCPEPFADPSSVASGSSGSPGSSGQGGGA